MAMSGYKVHLTHPPLEHRNKILNEYYKDLNNMDQIGAMVKYKILMQELYKRYNPKLRTRRISRDYWDEM